ncbi:MAG: GspH/FimT family pseudopilin [Desulfobacter postgatei]|uniref:GspH/FimT family pseudopilin n=1 Tax=Desulfobacter postgatei TaxID=2293 RepID=UPI0023F10A08|nr:GspH/FimT family pseudopilin [Desulfobacter postgatei]MDD4274812.1 GspH/FimT family pseudopilin [Desulfobacter postgatei]
MKSSNKKTGPKIRFSFGCSFPRNRSCPKSMEAGFTMIEMMIVVAIIAILSALAFPSLSTLIPRNRTKAAARDLKNDIQKAKLEAIKQNTDCLVVFTPQSGTDAGSCVTCIDLDNNNICTATDDIISQLDFNETNSVTLTNPDFSGNNKFVFNARGLPETTAGGMVAGSAVIQNTAEASYFFKIILASSGRVRID